MIPICKIAAFSGDGLVKTLLKLDKAFNENAISAALKGLGQTGARKLQMLLLSKSRVWTIQPHRRDRQWRLEP